MDIEEYDELWYRYALFYNKPFRYWLMFYKNFNIVEPEQRYDIDTIISIIEHYFNNKIVDLAIKFAIKINLTNAERFELDKKYILYDIRQKSNLLIFKKQYQDVRTMLKTILTRLLFSIYNMEKILILENIKIKS